MNFMQTLFKSFCVIILAWVSTNRTSGATITSADCTAANVQAAINSAANGDTVVIPAGTATWTNQVIVSKGITIQGAGIGQTILTDGTNNPYMGRLWLNGFGNNFVCVHDMTLAADTNSANNNGWIDLGKSTQTNASFHIYNVDFTNIWRRGAQTWGDIGGCIDHCTFESALNIAGNATGVSFNGDSCNSWQRPLAYGTTNGVVYVENCIFNWATNNLGANGMNDGYDGCRYVIRYCVSSNTWTGGHGLDSGGLQSPLSFEFYHNVMYGSLAAHLANMGQWRGGTGVIWSNTCVSQYPSTTPNFFLTCYRAQLNATVQIYTPAQIAPWGWTTGSNALDGNTDSYGYPACEQIGWTAPIKYYTNVTTPNGLGSNGYSVMVQSPVYSWGNTYNGQDMGCEVEDYVWAPWYNTNHPDVDDMVKTNRDFVNDTVAPGYVPLVFPHPLDTLPAIPIPVVTLMSPPPAAPSNLRITTALAASTGLTVVGTTVHESNTGTTIGTAALGLYGVSFYATKFTAASTYTGNGIQAYLSAVGAPAYNITASIYTDNNGPGTLVGHPSSPVNASSFAATESVVTFAGPSFTLVSGTSYWLVLNIATANNSNYVTWSLAGAYGTGVVDSSTTGATWTLSESHPGKFVLLSQ
jgi:hypothetical protein